MRYKKWTRYSLRFLLALTTVMCLALGFWEHNETRAVLDVKAESGGYSPVVIAPYLLRVEISDNVDVVARYRLWCFGTIVDLPNTRRYPETGGLVLGGVRPRIIFQEEPELQPLLSQ